MTATLPTAGSQMPTAEHRNMTAKSKLLRMDNVLIVVNDLEAAKAFFAELGMEMEGETTVEGLGGASYVSKLEGGDVRRQVDPIIRFTGETDRVYLDTQATCTVRDPLLRRNLGIEKSGSSSTVVWNPWIAKAKAMPDFGDDEWPGMLCVETANVGRHAIELPAGATHAMTARLSTCPTSSGTK